MQSEFFFPFISVRIKLMLVTASFGTVRETLEAFINYFFVIYLFIKQGVLLTVEAVHVLLTVQMLTIVFV